MKICPNCGKKAQRSQRRGLVEKKLLKPLRIHPYRCGECGLRFFRFSRHDHRKIRRSDAGIIADEQARRRSAKEESEYQSILSTLREGEKEAGLTPEIDTTPESQDTPTDGWEPPESGDR